MKLICGGRMSGKTEKLLREVHKTSIIIVCCSSASRYYIKKRAIEMNLNIQEPITYDQFVKEDIKGRFAFEDIDALLSSYFCLGKGEISIATITIDSTEFLSPPYLLGFDLAKPGSDTTKYTKYTKKGNQLCATALTTFVKNLKKKIKQWTAEK